MKLRIGCVVVGFLLVVLSLAAQTASSSSTSSQVPPLIPFSSVASDEGGSSLSGTVNITFSLYAAQRGGAPLWTETQNNVQLDATGHYSVQLGITKPNGVPTTLFTTGEARWLGVRIAEQGEQPRVLLLSVPYALKAGDAATIGGLPPSAFVLAAPLSGTVPSTGVEPTASQGGPPPSGDVTGTGTVNFLPLWDSTSDIISSVLFQKGTGSTAKIGINTITPATTLDVKGAGTIRGTLSLPAAGTATATKGANSQPLNLAASAFNSTSSTAVNQTFQWQSEPAGNDTSTPSGTLNLLFGEGATKPSETGFHIASNGQITFASGQTFPGTGDGTVTSVDSGAGLTGGPITSSGSLSIKTGGVTNAMLASSSLTVTANSPLSGGGAVSLGGSTSLGLKSCAANQILQFVSGAWACASPATGTVTSVGSGLGLSGGPITGSGTLAINTSVVPQLGAANTFTANQAVTGVITGGTSSGSTAGVLGEANATSGQTYGVGGLSSSDSGYGVEGLNVAASIDSRSTGVYGYAPGGVADDMTQSVGVYGSAGSVSTFGIGVLGTSSGTSNTSEELFALAGVWGDTGGAAESGYMGVLGTADDNSAGNFFNNSHQATLYLGNNSSATDTDLVLIAQGSNFGGLCEIDVSGDLTCNGDITTAVHAGGSRKVAVNTISSPEHWFEDAGSGQLSNGEAVVNIEAVFGQTVNTGVEYHVFLTPKGDCEGLYVSNETATGFEVHELRNGHSSIAFDYRIMAKRVGYEKVRLADLTEQLKKQEAYRQKMRRPRPTAMPKVSPKMPTPPVPLRAGVQPATVHLK